MNTLSHLALEARALAQADDAERLAFLATDRWIDYPRARQALEVLERLAATPERTRMPGLLIHGESNIGKSMIVRKFLRSHPPGPFDRGSGLQRIDVIAVEMPPVPQERRLYGQLLLALNAPYRPSDRLAAVEHTALTLLARVAPRLIVVDEVHNLLAGSAREQRAALNLLKFLSNQLRCSIVVVGTRDALAAMQTDAQIASRFPEFELARWQPNEELRSFLAGFERQLPLRQPSGIADSREMVATIVSATGGITGRISTLLTQAADAAIRSQAERVTTASLHAVARGIHW
jgi:hypothetical protein